MMNRQGENGSKRRLQRGEYRWNGARSEAEKKKRHLAESETFEQSSLLSLYSVGFSLRLYPNEYEWEEKISISN